MKNQFIALSLFSLLTLIGCKEKAPILDKGEAIIAGKVINFQGNTRTLKLAANGVAHEIKRTAIIDSLGNFRLVVELYHPHNIQLFFKQGFAKLFLFPSDSLYLEIDENIFSNERHPSYTISGTGKSVDFSTSIRDYLRFIGESKFYPNPKDKSAMEFLEILKTEISKQDSALHVFCESSEASSDFKNWATRDIRYRVANELVPYRISHQHDYDATVFDIALFPVTDDAAISTSYYLTYLQYYTYNVGFWQDSTSLSLFSEGKIIDAYTRVLNKIVGSEKKGLSRDIMCFGLLNGLMEESYEDFVEVLEEAKECIDCQLLQEALFLNKANYENQIAMNIASLDYGSTEEKEIVGDFWKELKEKYSGKVVYLDIWATWCSPCREEIPYAIELHDYFKDKDIAFVNLCLSSEKVGWEQMIVDHNITGDNYFFNQSQSQLLFSKLKLSGFPTYMIIDQKGNIIDKHAPPPSSNDEIRGILVNMI